MKTIKVKLSEVVIKLFNKEGQNISFTSDCLRNQTYQRKQHLFSLHTKDISSFQVVSFKIDEFNYKKNDDVYVEITYDDTISKEQLEKLKCMGK
jgi:hypothetical protein